MVSQPLTSIRSDEISAHRDMRGISARSGRSIAEIRDLLASLSAAVEELDAMDPPPLSEGFDFYGEVRRFEILLIKKALRMTSGSQIKAARLLKLKATTLNTKIKNYQICA